MSLKSKMMAAVAAVTVLAPAAMFAEEPASSAPIVSSITIPTIFEWQNVINTLVGNVGPVIGYCIAGTLAVVVVRWGLRWARGIGR